MEILDELEAHRHELRLFRIVPGVDLQYPADIVYALIAAAREGLPAQDAEPVTISDEDRNKLMDKIQQLGQKPVYKCGIIEDLLWRLDIYGETELEAEARSVLARQSEELKRVNEEMEWCAAKCNELDNQRMQAQYALIEDRNRWQAKCEETQKLWESFKMKYKIRKLHGAVGWVWLSKDGDWTKDQQRIKLYTIEEAQKQFEEFSALNEGQGLEYLTIDEHHHDPS